MQHGPPAQNPGTAIRLMSDPSSKKPEEARLIDVVLDENTIGRANADVEHERAVAIFDLIEENSFWPVGPPPNGFFSASLSSHYFYGIT